MFLILKMYVFNSFLPNTFILFDEIDGVFTNNTNGFNVLIHFNHCLNQ